MQQQKTSEKRMYQSISVTLSRLHSTRTIHTSRNLTDSEKKKDRSPDLLTTGFVAAKQNCKTPANPPQNSVQKRTQNQNRQKM